MTAAAKPPDKSSCALPAAHSMPTVVSAMNSATVLVCPRAAATVSATRENAALVAAAPLCAALVAVVMRDSLVDQLRVFPASATKAEPRDRAAWCYGVG